VPEKRKAWNSYGDHDSANRTVPLWIFIDKLEISKRTADTLKSCQKVIVIELPLVSRIKDSPFIQGQEFQDSTQRDSTNERDGRLRASNDRHSQEVASSQNQFETVPEHLR
jgi:hypothetical protein